MSQNSLFILAAPIVALVLVKGYMWDVQVAKDAVLATEYMRIPDAEAAIKADPNNALAHERLGEAVQGQDTLRAIRGWRIVLHLQPNNREVQFLLAYKLYETGKINEAKSIYQRLAAQDDSWGRSAKRHLQEIHQKQ